jgi:hypothetical protein
MGIAMKLNRKIRKPEISIRGRSQGRIYIRPGTDIIDIRPWFRPWIKISGFRIFLFSFMAIPIAMPNFSFLDRREVGLLFLLQTFPFIYIDVPQTKTISDYEITTVIIKAVQICFINLTKYAFKIQKICFICLFIRI